jgi:hypothetical protein
VVTDKKVVELKQVKEDQQKKREAEHLARILKRAKEIKW